MKDVRQNFEFFFTSSSPHLVRKFMQPPLLRLKVAYYVCFWRYPLPPQCRRHKWKPPYAIDIFKFVHFLSVPVIKLTLYQAVYAELAHKMTGMGLIFHNFLCPHARACRGFTNCPARRRHKKLNRGWKRRRERPSGRIIECNFIYRALFHFSLFLPSSTCKIMMRASIYNVQW